MQKEQLLEIFWGIAVADAIGNSLEFLPIVTDADFAKAASARTLYFTDDTQMTLFEYEALHASHAYAVRRWYTTQTHTSEHAMCQTGLLAFTSMYRQEAPGATCMRSAQSLQEGRTVVNLSKGNGTVMRAAPFAIWAELKGLSKETAYLLAQDDARSTHLHPFAWQSSVLLVAIYLNLFKGMPFRESVFQAVQDLPSCSEVGKIVLSVYDPFKWQAMRSRRCGWVAEEALALAVGANHYHASYETTVRAACQGVECDSDTVASIAGGLCVANGYQVPSVWKNRLYGFSAVEYITSLPTPTKD